LIDEKIKKKRNLLQTNELPKIMINYVKKIFFPLGLRAYYFYLRTKCYTLGLRFFPPNYAFFEEFLQGGIAIDVGVGNNPDFTLLLMKTYNIESFVVVDPTLKHMDKLRTFEKQHPRTRYLPYALGAKNGSRTFYESQSNESGSLRKDHTNVQNDPLITYNVQVVTLNRLLEECGNKPIVIMKIDIEGEEYELINLVSKSDLQRIKQLIIEFHHDTVGNYSMTDTLRGIKVIENLGMKSILYNGRDCLFYWGQ
jgi:FkbM family methyltransferase